MASHDHFADSRFQVALAFPDFAGNRTAVVPSRTVKPVLFDQRRSDDMPENRPPVIAATGAHWSPVPAKVGSKW